MGNNVSNLNKNDNFKQEEDKSFSPVFFPKNNHRPTRECYSDRSSIQTVVRYLYSNQDEFNYNLYTSVNIDEELLGLSILITDQKDKFSNLELHPLFRHTFKDFSMHISSKKDILNTPVFFKITPKIIKSRPKSKQIVSIDPLPDNLFHINHKRFDRQEKHIRNIEREKFAHDRFYLEQKICQLYGSEWKKVVIAISKITGSKEPLEIQRQFIIKKLEHVLEKFNSWKEFELKNKRKSKGVANSSQDCVLKTNRTNFLKNHLKKQKLDTNIPEISVNKKKDFNSSNVDKNIQKKRRKSTNSIDSVNNHIDSPLFNIMHEKMKKKKNVSIKDDDKLIRINNSFIKNENKCNKNQNKFTRNENKSIKIQNTLNESKNVFTQEGHIHAENGKKTNKTVHFLTEDKKKPSFIKSPHVRQAIANNWRRSNRMILAFGQPLPKMTTKVQEFSLPFEILKEVRK
ncbi:hypothetical protein PMAC_002449 [Pneumocystis sp. 'macacae']|nr:hypothetical protein PMAC_002449 [Pneumocystis sp. 'macacae']